MSGEQSLRQEAEAHGQGHVFRFWDDLDPAARDALLEDLAQVDFPLMDRLAETWIKNEPEAEHFESITPVPVIPVVDPARADAQAALEPGEQALRDGRVGLFLVAGGQGTRLGFEGPKGAYPVGPISKATLFQAHAEKIRNLQRRYDCVLPWYIMVSETNAEETEAFFKGNEYFMLDPANVKFLKQRMVPCMDEDGRFMLESPGRLAMNPNGHGGSLPAMVESGVLQDARRRGIDLLSYFQVDNWAAKIADPYFIGYHVLNNAGMSSKSSEKKKPRESVGVHCLCDGVHHIIEYSELDIYPQLLETDADGKLLHFAGNPAIHILSVDFVEGIFNKFEEFPWHRAHKAVPYVDDQGQTVEPEQPNAYKFETFVFDALRFCDHPPVVLEIDPPGEYTPIKQFAGSNSVEAAWRTMREYWARWIEAAGGAVPRDREGRVSIEIEISPGFALDSEEFREKTVGWTWPDGGDIAISADGQFVQPES